jgi:hypothetical protein
MSFVVTFKKGWDFNERNFLGNFWERIELNEMRRINRERNVLFDNIFYFNEYFFI